MIDSTIHANSSPSTTPEVKEKESTIEPLERSHTSKQKPSIEEPPTIELKSLPSHVKYSFLEGDNLPLIISSKLSIDEKEELFTILKAYKKALAWKISDIQGINPTFCTHKILMEDNFTPSVQPQRRLKPNMKDVVRKEVAKLLDAGLIYPIIDSAWVSLVQVVSMKVGTTVVTNDHNELILTRTITGWRVCIDYRKLNDAKGKDHFSLPFIEQMLERKAGKPYYCLLDGFSGYFQIPIATKDHEKITFACPYSTFAYRRMPFGLCNALATFQHCMVAIFHDMLQESMEILMDDFSVYDSSFHQCLTNLEKILQRCEETNVVIN